MKINKWWLLNYSQLLMAMVNLPWFPHWNNVCSFVFCVGMFWMTRKIRKGGGV